MAKELPYFRNTVQEWQNGKISTMSYSCKGLFWDIVNYYWAQNCRVTENQLSEKFKTSSKTIQKLIKKEVICVQNGIISISFLDQQLSELNQKKTKFSEWGKLGQKAKKKKAPLKTDLSYKDKDKDKEKDKDKKADFEKARKFYPGTKKGLDIEFRNFCKKPDWKNIIPLLEPAILKELNFKLGLKRANKFCAEWAHFSTWINQERWTQEFERETRDAPEFYKPPEYEDLIPASDITKRLEKKLKTG